MKNTQTRPDSKGINLTTSMVKSLSAARGDTGRAEVTNCVCGRKCNGVIPVGCIRYDITLQVVDARYATG